MKLNKQALKEVAMFWSLLAGIMSYIGLFVYLFSLYHSDLLYFGGTGIPIFIIFSIFIYKTSIPSNKEKNNETSSN